MTGWSSPPRPASGAPGRTIGRWMGGRSRCAAASRAASSGWASSGSTCGSCTASTPRCRARSSSTRCVSSAGRNWCAMAGSARWAARAAARRSSMSRGARCRTAPAPGRAPATTWSPIARAIRSASSPGRRSAPGRWRGRARRSRGSRAPGCDAGPDRHRLVAAQSPVILAIPGTGSLAHLEENVAAAGIALTEAEFEALEAL